MSYNFLIIIFYIFANSSLLSSGQGTPTFQPTVVVPKKVVAPTRKPIYSYPTKKPTKSTVKPTRKPTFKPGKKPTFLPTTKPGPKTHYYNFTFTSEDVFANNAFKYTLLINGVFLGKKKHNS